MAAVTNYDTIKIEGDALLKDSNDQQKQESTRTTLTSTSTFLQSILWNTFLVVTLVVVVVGCSAAFFMANTATHQDQVATTATTSLFRLDGTGGENGGSGVHYIFDNPKKRPSKNVNLA
mmetsp:Transcript_53906/g.61006  ORF Transcript_53906/g.61006 Transcript_53906/m.61006 type:complete len:119 (+) Transcript_53906:96-452(+)